MKDVATAQAVVDAGADYLGLNFVEKSPRFVDVETARQIVALLPDHVEPVGLFCDHPADYVLATAEAVGLRTVQLHGHESPAYSQELGNLNLLKVFGFDRDTLSEHIADWKNHFGNVTALLIDTPPKPDAEITGGTGEVFDWESLAAMDFSQLPPLMLAGGLTPDNVGQAIRTVRPWAVDVSSGVESSRGVKDPAMIADFCAAVREADASLGVE
ncbi:phosphoribosylanthranilate isomerase [Algisphaera agarilytica]|uniref:N-(5'-phosphoribosyl)anthranilate isomerase n=1 Tax=Algisphaera agarilytica TaxID=1385975 RepID=A0A7X0H7V8_9BACT|nr:phosphoribosylanthranilate isomerase [Algisphaera agarilytica]MBB6430902.1 phosphoribosylanthranilate isomerase [Algisphaera agarilytica]